MDPGDHLCGELGCPWDPQEKEGSESIGDVCLGSAVRWGLELDFRVIQKVGGLEASGFCLPETGRELKRAM